MNGLHILGTGRALPANIVTNDDLALRVETSDEWIVSRTGIRERRFATHETLTQLAVEAARAALERAGVSPQELGLCLTATVSPDCATPSQACLIHQALHLPEDCPAFDLSAGCTGFLYAMETSAALLPPGSHVLCAVSGGADSVCLLHALYHLRPSLNFSLSAAHYDHGLRGEDSTQDARFVEQFVSLCCGEQRLPDGAPAAAARSCGPPAPVRRSTPIST